MSNLLQIIAELSQAINQVADGDLLEGRKHIALAVLAIDQLEGVTGASQDDLPNIDAIINSLAEKLCGPSYGDPDIQFGASGSFYRQQAKEALEWLEFAALIRDLNYLQKSAIQYPQRSLYTKRRMQEISNRLEKFDVT